MKTWMLVSLFLLSFTPFGTPEVEVLEKTNDYRKKNGRDTLVLDSFLCKLAQEHSEKMAAGKVPFSHQGFEKRSKKIRETLNANAVAENVYMADWEASGSEAVASWIDSKGHRANLLGREYKRMGVGRAVNDQEEVYFTQIFAD